MNKTYIKPTLQATWIASSLLQSQSNTVSNENNVTLNPNTMGTGDGSDAVKAKNYNVWNEDWEH